MDQDRLSSLDAFRGLTIAAMILVNNPGTGKFVFPPLRHADWHGWTPTDLIFPFFLFIVGVSLALSLSHRKESGKWEGLIYVKILKRSVILFGLGLFLQLFPYFRFEGMRIPGVLQRIAVCFFLTSLLYLHTGKFTRLGLVLVLLAGYWIALKLIPVPGVGAGVLDYTGNLPAFIDNKLMPGHLYEPAFDPEGLLSTLPALATALIGTLIGDVLRSARTLRWKNFVLIGAGIVLTPLGLVLNRWMPINKKIWTSSYVIFTAGAALLLLAACFFLMDILRWRKWAFLFLVFGTNSIAAYAGSGIMAKLIRLVFVPAAGGRIPVQQYIYEKLLAPWAGPYVGSLLWPIALIIIWLFILWPLYRKKIFIKV